MSLDLDDLTNTAECLVNISTTLTSNPEPESSGGYLFYFPHAIPESDSLPTSQLIKIGSVTDSRNLALYKRFAQEKAHRLLAHWFRSPKSCLSSWQTRDKDKKMYGGAVLLNTVGSDYTSCRIISFSGLDEHVDEAVSLILGHHSGLLDRGINFEHYTSISENPVFPELFEVYRKM